MFCQTDLHDDPVRVPSPSDGHRVRSRLPRASKRKKAEIGQYVKSLLPKDCELVGMTTDGIVGKFNPYCANCNNSCLLFSSAEMFKTLLWQTVWTQIRLLLQEQSVLGPRCLLLYLIRQ